MKVSKRQWNNLLLPTHYSEILINNTFNTNQNASQGSDYGLHCVNKDFIQNVDFWRPHVFNYLI